MRMPTVEYDGRTYSLRSRKVEIPDLQTMDRFAALQWLCRYTRARGYSKPRGLEGMSGAISVRIAS